MQNTLLPLSSLRRPPTKHDTTAPVSCGDAYLASNHPTIASSKLLQHTYDKHTSTPYGRNRAGWSLHRSCLLL